MTWLLMELILEARLNPAFSLKKLAPLAKLTLFIYGARTFPESLPCLTLSVHCAYSLFTIYFCVTWRIEGIVAHRILDVVSLTFYALAYNFSAMQWYCLPSRLSHLTPLARIGLLIKAKRMEGKPNARLERLRTILLYITIIPFLIHLITGILNAIGIQPELTNYIGYSAIAAYSLLLLSCTSFYLFKLTRWAHMNKKKEKTKAMQKVLEKNTYLIICNVAFICYVVIVLVELFSSKDPWTYLSTLLPPSSFFSSNSRSVNSTLIRVVTIALLLSLCLFLSRYLSKGCRGYRDAFRGIDQAGRTNRTTGATEKGATGGEKGAQSEETATTHSPHPKASD